MPDTKPTLFRPATTPAESSSTDTPAATLPTGKLKFDGIATLKSGAVYFGQFTEDDAGIVTVTVPTAGGSVRTIRQLSRANIQSVREIDPPLILRLAKVGPHLLSRADVDRIAPEVKPTAPPPADAGTAPAA